MHSLKKTPENQDEQTRLIIETGRKVLRIESRAIAELENRVDSQFYHRCWEIGADWEKNCVHVFKYWSAHPFSTCGRGQSWRPGNAF
jgi:hypothetical protein